MRSNGTSAITLQQLQTKPVLGVLLLVKLKKPRHSSHVHPTIPTQNCLKSRQLLVLLQGKLQGHREKAPCFP
jgi:hypothetical protein